jgi:hypothetical protein
VGAVYGKFEPAFIRTVSWLAMGGAATLTALVIDPT